MNKRAFIQSSTTQLSTREQILQAAFETFGDLGYAETTVRKIADRAGIAPGSIYTYFADKKELFRATVEAGWKDFEAEIEEILQRDQSYQESLTSIVERGFESLRQMSPLLRGMFSEANRMDLVADHIETICESVEQIVLQGGKSHAPAAARLAASVSAGHSAEFPRFHMRLLVSGVLLRVAVTAPEDLDEELRSMKRNLIYGFITHSLQNSLQNGRSTSAAGSGVEDSPS